MGKFKVGDRVRVKNIEILSRDFVKIGDTAHIIAVHKDGKYADLKFNNGKLQTAVFDELEPAPLFTVGDKVRFKGSSNLNALPGATAVVTKEYNGEFVWVKWDKNHLTAGQMDGGYEPHHFEHATTDEEAVTASGLFRVDAKRIDRILASDKPSTTGFTIPLDEEALPARVYWSDIVNDVNEQLQAHLHWAKQSTDFITSALSAAQKTRPAIVALVENGQPLPADQPKVHKTATKATKEADRLAVRYPGQEFGVFELVSKRVASVDIREAA